MLRLFALLFVWGLSAGAGAAYFAIQTVSRTLPDDLLALREAPSKASRVYSANGDLIGQFHLENREIVSLDDVPSHVYDAFVAAEDGRFWSHPGFDIPGILRAIYVNIRADAPRHGASTITQQLARLLMGESKKTLDRKMRELLLSVRLERELDKRAILEMYLNRVFLGNAHGIQAAARGYFGKDVGDLSLGEGALLAGIVQRPSAFAPTRNMKAARRRQAYTLGRMVADGRITEAQRKRAMDEPIALIRRKRSINQSAAPYFVEYVRQWARKRYGSKALYSGGLRIFTTMDTTEQRAAETAVRRGLERLTSKAGFRGPIGHLEPSAIDMFRAQPPQRFVPQDTPDTDFGRSSLLKNVAYVGVITDIGRHHYTIAVGSRVLYLEAYDRIALKEWRGPRQPGTQDRAIMQVGDLIPVKLGKSRRGGDCFVLAQDPTMEAALVSMDPNTGRVLAMVGGYDFRKSQLNRAVQARRQIGSTLKPFVYAVALKEGRTQLDILHDSEIVVRVPGETWSPQNFNGRYAGDMTMRTAIANSINTVCVKLVLQYGVDPVIDLLRKVGVRSFLRRRVSIALGSPDMTLAQIVGALAPFANGGRTVGHQADGKNVPPGRYVDLVTDENGQVLDDFRDTGLGPRAMSEEIAYLVVDLMKTVVSRGTATVAQEIRRPVAGKTGTSTDFKDAWFVGMTTDRIAGVWIGKDNAKSMGRRITGGSAAAPIWVDFMKMAHPKTPARDWTTPPDVTLVRANELTGQPLGPHDENVTWVPFLRGTVPDRFRSTKRSLRSFDDAPAFGEIGGKAGKRRRRKPR